MTWPGASGPRRRSSDGRNEVDFIGELDFILNLEHKYILTLSLDQSCNIANQNSVSRVKRFFHSWSPIATITPDSEINSQNSGKIGGCVRLSGIFLMYCNHQDDWCIVKPCSTVLYRQGGQQVISCALINRPWINLALINEIILSLVPDATVYEQFSLIHTWISGRSFEYISSTSYRIPSLVPVSREIWLNRAPKPMNCNNFIWGLTFRLGRTLSLAISVA